jgi:hypothetical protein
MSTSEIYSALRALERPLGEERRDLVLGDLRIRLEGLGAGLAGDLERRWGAFLQPASSTAAGHVLRFFQSAATGWLSPWRPGEHYRLEALDAGGSRLILSYHFALCAEPAAGEWRVAISSEPEEPIERLVENAARYLVARIGAESGGFVLHAAGVLHEGRAWLLAGPSRAGKTTAVGLCAPALSLGDDLGLVLPGGGGWRTTAMPFDNSERIEHDPPRGWLPVAGILRLRQAVETRIEKPPVSLGVAALMSCAAFPWALPDLADALLEQVRAFVQEGRFGELHFTPDADLRNTLFAAGPAR